MNVKDIDLKLIKPYKNNPRINEKAVAEVVQSIKDYGFKQPIVVDKKYIIIVGHTRYLAAIELGLKKVPGIVAEDLSPKQVKAYRIADNKVGEFAKWDNTLLKDELKDLDNMFTGFSETEMDSLFFGFSSSPLSTGITEESDDDEGAEEVDVKLTFIMSADERDLVVKKLNVIKQKNQLETLAEALIKLTSK